MKFSRNIFVLLLAFLFIPAIVAAETLYVSDQLIITLRQGKSTEYKILKTLKTGTPMEVLEKKKGDDYVKVRLQSGEEGYVLAQYLTSETPKTTIISRLEKQVAKTQEQLAQANEKLTASSQAQKNQTQKEAALEGNIDDLNRSLAEAKEELGEVNEKYNALLEDASNVAEIVKERDQLKKTNEKLSSEIRTLTAANSDLLWTSAIKWFLAGGGVLFFGWMLGKMSRKKQSRF